MSQGDQPDAWQKWVRRHKGRPHSYHDAYGNTVPDDLVENNRDRPEEPDLDWEIDFTDFLKTLPEMQRLAIEKRLLRIPLTEAEQKALERSREAVGKWLELRSLDIAL